MDDSRSSEGVAVASSLFHAGAMQEGEAQDVWHAADLHVMLLFVFVSDLSSRSMLSTLWAEGPGTQPDAAEERTRRTA